MAAPARRWALAREVGPTGHVLGLDFVEEMLTFARVKAQRLGLTNVEFRRQDGEQLAVPANSVDIVTMRFGLMFMPDPLGALRRCYQALKPGGRIVLATWAPAAKNPWAAMPNQVIRRHAQLPPPVPGAPGLFALDDPSKLRGLLAEAGFKEATVDEAATGYDFAQGADFFTFIFDLAGPVAVAYAGLSGEVQALVRTEVIAETEKYRTSNGAVRVPGVALVAAATK